MCYIATPIATATGGQQGRTPLVLTIEPPIGWGAAHISALIQSIAYSFADDTPLVSPKTARFSYVPIGTGVPASGRPLVSITLSPVPDPPSITTNLPLHVDLGQSGQITTAQLEASDPDSTVSELLYSVVDGPAEGELLVGGSPDTMFTQSQVNSGQVAYAHVGERFPQIPSVSS